MMVVTYFLTKILQSACDCVRLYVGVSCYILLEARALNLTLNLKLWGRQ